MASVVAALLLVPAFAQAGSVSVGSAYGFGLAPSAGADLPAGLDRGGADGFFGGGQNVRLAGFTAATGLSIDKLTSVTLTLEGRTAAVGSGGIYNVLGGGLTAVPDATPLFASFMSDTATERNEDGLTGIRVSTTAVSTTAEGADLSVFAMDDLGVDVFNDVAFYGFLGQLEGGRGFTSYGFVNLTYNFDGEATGGDGPATTVPTPAAAAGGLLCLGGMLARRRR